MASSSSSFISIVKKYHVFISFRGEDTRKKFTSYLYNSLCEKKIQTYIDEDELKKGDEIAPALLKAITESMISIIVFSEKYASSSWCLNELNHILHCMDNNKQLVVPVFYDVDPSDIRHQRGSYADAFAEHKRRFGKENDKMQQWRKSLTTAANLSGWDSSVCRSESELIKEIVKDIMKKLENIIPPTDDLKDLFGIDKHIEKIEPFLSIDSADRDDTRILGIFGMGGIGKTTIARVLFNKFSPQFEGYSFLENVKVEVKKHHPPDLQKKIFSELLKEKELTTVSQFVRDRLRRTKVLLVLDDVDDAKQLENLAKGRDWLGRGSVIIVTTRDAQVLENIKADRNYKVDEMNRSDAVQFFYSKAFQGKSPTTDYMDLSKKVVENYCKGNPLALKVLGSHLCSRSVEEWESELEKLRSIPHQEVQDMLKISYDGLNNNAKDMFLDIACFFRGSTMDFVKRVLGYNYLGVVMEIRILVDKSLITVNDRDEISMHDLVQQMGREIVRQQSTYDPGKRSRLWSSKDICLVLNNNQVYFALKRCQGTRKIQAMSYNMYQVNDAFSFEPLVFKEICNLWFLDVFTVGNSNLDFPEGLQFLPNTLRYLRWNYCPLISFPPTFMPANLGELVIHGSRLERLWHRDMALENLKVLDLNGCRSLTQIPDLSRAPNLEDLDITFCSNVDKFPVLPNPCKIKYLRMTATNIEEVPPSINCLARVIIWTLDCCYRLKSLPTSICELKFLKILALEESSKFEEFPEILEPMERLEQLLLDITGIRKLPQSIENLIGLKTLSLQHCESLEVIPCTIYNMSLEHLNLYGCKKLKRLPELPFSLKHLNATGCDSLEMVSNPWIALAQHPRDYIVEQEFHFPECSKLDNNNIVTEFQIRVLAPAILTKSEPHEKKSCGVPGVGICIPGNKIPMWFSPQSEGSLITMKLDPNWYDANFMGFVVCAIISFKTSSIMQVTLQCEMCFKTASGESHIKTQRPFKLKTNSGLAHMILQSFDEDYSDVFDAVEVSFNFRHNGIDIRGSKKLNSEVKKCGIRMLYLQDAEQFRIANSQHLPEKQNVVITSMPEPSTETGTNDFGVAPNCHDESEPSEHRTDQLNTEASLPERINCCMIL